MVISVVAGVEDCDTTQTRAMRFSFSLPCTFSHSSLHLSVSPFVYITPSSIFNSIHHCARNAKRRILVPFPICATQLRGQLIHGEVRVTGRGNSDL